MKRTSLYFILMVLVLLVINTYFYLDFYKDFSPEPHNLSVVAEHRYMRYPVYFVGKDRLVESREYTSVIWRDRYSNIMDVYFAQADQPLGTRGRKILDIPVDKIKVTPEYIYVYTRLSAFSDARYNRGNFYLYLMSFINTLTEEGRGKTVYFIFDEKTKAPELYGIDLDQGFKYDGSIVAENTDGVETFVRQFFQEMYTGEYQSVYRKLTREFRETRRAGDFTKAFDSYSFDHNNEFPWDFVVEKDQDDYSVTVVFSPGSINKEEVWRVGEINGKLMVNYSQDLVDRLP